jgi:hypothetical protein
VRGMHGEGLVAAAAAGLAARLQRGKTLQQVTAATRDGVHGERSP